MILFKIKDFNFQNYLDFPVLFKNKDHLYKHLLKKGFDTKKVHYFNCAKTFNFKEKFPNSQRIENEILCLPNNSEIDRIFIDKLIIKKLSYFMTKNNKDNINIFLHKNELSDEEFKDIHFLIKYENTDSILSNLEKI